MIDQQQGIELGAINQIKNETSEQKKNLHCPQINLDLAFRSKYKPERVWTTVNKFNQGKEKKAFLNWAFMSIISKHSCEQSKSSFKSGAAASTLV